MKRISTFRGINMGMFYSSSKVILLVTFIVFIVLGEKLTAERVRIVYILNLKNDTYFSGEVHASNLIFFILYIQVFLSVALYNNIRLVMTFFFPFGITQAAESLISVQRLQVMHR